MATPQVPPRPTRSKHPVAPAMSDAAAAAPKVPPRPAVRRIDRSPSPDRYAPSPLNDMPRKPSTSALYSNAKNNRSSSSVDVPPRPPSVTLPSLGQEGNEYGDLDLHEQQNALEKTRSAGSAMTSHVHSELPLHAPKPGLSKTGAKAQVAAVTRTDSSQAAAALGISSLNRGVVSPTRDDPDPHGRPLKSKSSSGYVRSGSAMSAERPPSASQLDEHGIPQIGRHVPLLFNAGDVQAPSPAPESHNGSMSNSVEDLHPQRHHRRKHSGREVFHGPPGSYGLHGHQGAAHTDQFEKSWYAKHPEEQVKEDQGHYGSALSGNRPEFALSSEDLNKIVRASAGGAGFGTVQNIVGLPDEQIGYMASDEYANRLKSPRVQTGAKHRPTNSQTHVESPLRRTSFPQDSLDAKLIPANKEALEKTAQGGIIHIDFPDEHVNRITGEGVDTHESHLQRRISVDHGYAEDHGYHAPILASDELTPGAEWQQPAMSPVFPGDRRGSAHFDDSGLLHRHLSHLGGSASSSRAGSRPGSIHGVPPLTKIHSHDDHDDRHTPLENVEEYEPLFPDDDGKLKKPTTQAERFKQRPELRQRFPSQDIWEDTPDSLRLETEVDSPEPAEQRLHPQSITTEAIAQEKENIRHEAAKLGIPLDETDVLTPTEELRAKSAKKLGMPKHALAVTAQRFPSRDIWEDSPDYAALTTEVADLAEPIEGSSAAIEPEAIVSNDAAATDHPSVPARPVRARGSEDLQEPGNQPQVPARPNKKLSTESMESAADINGAGADGRRPPSIPERPKPQIPARPLKSVSRDSAEGAPLDKSISAESHGGVEEEATKLQKPPPPAVKAKPNIPMRPTGSKIAALQAGFMADLNSRLKTGPPAPPAPKTEEPEEDKVPLQDARKGRARGPARRKPGVASTTQQEEGKLGAPKLSFSSVWTVWHSESDGSIVVPPLTERSVLKEPDIVQPEPEHTLSEPSGLVSQAGPVVTEPEKLSHKDASHPLAKVESAGIEPQASSAKGEALDIEPSDSAAHAGNKDAIQHEASEGAAAQPAVIGAVEPQVSVKPGDSIVSSAVNDQDRLLNESEQLPASEKPAAVED